MSNYLISHYKGKYRLKAPIDMTANTFPRNLNGGFEDIDVYIDCYKNVQIFSYGHGILEAYIPSLSRGRNIVKIIQSQLKEEIIFDIQETDGEVLFKFKAMYMEQLELYLKPKTNGANISPFSVRNIKPKTNYTIPDADLNAYKEIVSKIPQNELISLVHTTKKFIEAYAKKNLKGVDIKADMALKGIKGKDYIHSIGAWDKYIEYLKKNINIKGVI